jgi:hypothetical protein
MASHLTLRDRQIGEYLLVFFMGNHTRTYCATASIEKILNLNQEPLHNPDELETHTGLLPESIPLINTDGQPIWKVLVFDNLGRDVISSVGSAPSHTASWQKLSLS